jgi:hypothetical protein
MASTTANFTDALSILRDFESKLSTPQDIADFNKAVDDVGVAAEQELDGAILLYSAKVPLFGGLIGKLAVSAVNKELDAQIAAFNAAKLLLPAPDAAPPAASQAVGVAMDETSLRFQLSASSALTPITRAISNLWNKAKAWVVSEEKVVVTEAENIGAQIIKGGEAVFGALGPTLAAEARDILAKLPAEFLQGATLADILEEMLKSASADLSAAVKTAEPQLIQVIIGVLIHSL